MKQESMDGVLVLDGRFRVFRDGSINQIVDGIERPAKVFGANNPKKYITVAYRVDRGKQAHVYVHRLIALAFIPNPNGYPQINHKDGDKHNNHVENLEWVTASMNNFHAYRTGLSNQYSKKKKCSSCGAIIPNNATSGFCQSCLLKERKTIQTRKKLEENIGKKTGFYFARVKAGLSVAQVMEALSVSDAAVYWWETGVTTPNAKRLPEVARLYGTTIEDLLSGNPTTQPNCKDVNVQ